jgi:hypothetical protein
MKNGGGGKSSPAKQITTPTTNQRMKMKYPRSMNEAFPKTVEYSAAIEIHVAQHSIGDKVIRVLALVALVVIGLDIFIWRP